MDLPTLNKYFNERYARRFEELNKNVYVCATTDQGHFEAPTVMVSAGGGTEVRGAGPTELNQPAIVSLEHKVLRATGLIYRLAFPYNEMEIATGNQQYFNYLMDSVIEVALGNYRKTVGDENIVRFGKTYCSPYIGDTTEVFRLIPGTDFVELRLHGAWASKEIVSGN